MTPFRIPPFQGFNMRFVTLALLAVLVACGRDSTAPPPPIDDAWAGSWMLVSVNGSALPFDFEVSGYPARITSRALVLLSGGSGVWSDSSEALCAGATPSSKRLCEAGGSAVISWAPTADTVVVSATPASTGTVSAIKRFVAQKDGSILRTDGGETEIYRKR
jgi:hypothetical protein